MKRLHIVGKSKDNKRLFLAQKKDAKFGSFEIPIGRKLLRLIEDVQEAREERKRPATPAPPANEGDVTGVRLVRPRAASTDGGPRPGPAAPSQAAPTTAPAVNDPGRPPPGPAGQLRIAPDDIDIPIGTEALDQRIGEAPETPAAPLFETEEAPATLEPPPEPVEAPVRVRIPRPEPTRRRPEIPARSKLSPAEIQGLIRAGRGVRSVANMAGTPVAWVKYLAEPIQQERLGIVQQMLSARQERARLGASSAPIGESILANLRGKGVRNPESVLDHGFTAHRPDGREWRVRLVFDHRGNRYSAIWSFDPQTREVTPLNSTASQLGWRRQPSREDEEAKPRPRPKRSTRARSSGVRRASTRKKPAARKASSRRAAAARKTTRKSGSSKKKTSGTRSSRR